MLDGLQELLADRHRLFCALLRPDNMQAAGSLGEHFRLAKEMAQALKEAPASEQREMLLALVARIVIADDRISIILRSDAVRDRMGVAGDGDNGPRRPEELAIDLPVAFRRRGVETKLIISEAGPAATTPDPNLVSLLAKAEQWTAELRSDSSLSVNALAQRHQVDSGDVSRILPLAFLSPDIVEAILDGRQPVELTAARLKRTDLPISWANQRRSLGFGSRRPDRIDPSYCR